MIQRWATLNTKGQVIRLDSTNRHIDALPVIYPPPPECNPATHEVRQLPFNEWVVTPSSVTVTYGIFDINFQEIRDARLLDLEYVFEEQSSFNDYTKEYNQKTYRKIYKDITNIQDQTELYMLDVYHAYMDYIQSL